MTIGISIGAPSVVPDKTGCMVTDNCRTLKFDTHEFEKEWVVVPRVPETLAGSLDET